MVFHGNLCNLPICMILVIFLLSLRNANSDDSIFLSDEISANSSNTTDTSDSTPDISFTSTSDDPEASNGTTSNPESSNGTTNNPEPSTGTSVDPNPSTSSETTVVTTGLSTPRTEITTTETMTATQSTSTMQITTGNESVSDTTTTSGNTNGCFPGAFPFGNTCISPVENGSVIITALILSIVSFIGVLGTASYMLFSRKYTSKKGRPITKSYNIPQHEMVKSPSRIESAHSSISSPNRQQNTSVKEKFSHNSTPLNRTTITKSSRVKANVLEKQPEYNMVKMKQRQSSHDRSNRRISASNSNPTINKESGLLDVTDDDDDDDDDDSTTAILPTTKRKVQISNVLKNIIDTNQRNNSNQTYNNYNVTIPTLQASTSNPFTELLPIPELPKGKRVQSTNFTQRSYESYQLPTRQSTNKYEYDDTTSSKF
ncbi:unnamed protein product [Adineta steineri]|uniref:Uncharacterized protein n=1 Tax=Adineta steineri TaxID=433720 RepID=A0A815FUV4_9BILA|nr:unnamed protein product [Adineta steineri]CAF1589272.1 unnamed protein product [Adineta steineri]